MFMRRNIFKFVSASRSTTQTFKRIVRTCSNTRVLDMGAIAFSLLCHVFTIFVTVNNVHHHTHQLLVVLFITV